MKLLNPIPLIKSLPQRIFKSAAPAASRKLRPGIGSGRDDDLNPSIQLAFYLEHEVSIFANTVLTLKQETFRRGISWKPRFAKKCLVCGAEYQEKVDHCDCGSLLLREPSRMQIEQFKRFGSGDSFLEKATYNDTSLKEELKDFQHNIDVSDHGVLLCVKNYILSDAGEIISAIPLEFISVDPRDIKPIEQANGLPGGKVWICLEHRKETASEPGQTCRICNRQMHEAYFETAGLAGEKKYYIEGEVLIKHLYYKTGYPPILKAIYDAYAYHHLERRTYDFYKEGHGRGILTFPTNNPDSFEAMWEAIILKWRSEPSYTPGIAFDPGQGKGVAAYVKLMDDPNPETLEVKKDLRERLGSMFGVSLVFQNDTSASGGLNNEGLQITVTNRAIEFRQALYNGDPETHFKDGVFSWIVGQFNITDYIPQLNPSEEQDEMAEKQRFAQDAQNAKLMYDMGFDVIYENDKFTYSRQSKPKPAPILSGFPAGSGAGSEPAQQPVNRPSGAPPNMHKSDPDELSEYQGDQLIKDYAQDALTAIKRGALYSFYSGIDSEEKIDAVHNIIKNAFLTHQLSLRNMIEKIEALGIEYEHARMIARTESTAVAMTARSIGWKRLEQARGEVFKYKAVITNDARTSPISKRIKAAVDAEGGAVTLDRLREIYKEESTKPYIKGDPENSGMGAAWSGWMQFVAHPYERDSIVRVV